MGAFPVRVVLFSCKSWKRNNPAFLDTLYYSGVGENVNPSNVPQYPGATYDGNCPPTASPIASADPYCAPYCNWCSDFDGPVGAACACTTLAPGTIVYNNFTVSFHIEPRY